MYGFIADTHLGVKLPHGDFMRSLAMFLHHIKKSQEECHAIFVCGDLFDHRLSITDAQFAAEFISALVYNHCGKHGGHVPIYFVHGTDSHDQDQYPIYISMINEIDRSHVFYVTEACTFPIISGEKVLFLPQEYRDVDYTKLFNDTYDIIAGHGPMSSETKNPCKSAKYEIVQSADLLGKISKICVFGHYHGYTDFGNNVYYAGPWLQWKYGEDEPKVFFFCNDKFEVETIPNSVAMKFETISITNPEQLREYLSKDIVSPHRFIIQSSRTDMETYRGIINSSKSPFTTFRIEEIVDEDDLGLTVDETLDAQLEAVQPVPALITYIKDKYGVDAEEQLNQYESQINKEDAK